MTGSIKRFRVPKRTRLILWVEFGRGGSPRPKLSEFTVMGSVQNKTSSRPTADDVTTRPSLNPAITLLVL